MKIEVIQSLIDDICHLTSLIFICILVLVIRQKNEA